MTLVGPELGTSGGRDEGGLSAPVIAVAGRAHVVDRIDILADGRHSRRQDIRDGDHTMSRGKKTAATVPLDKGDVGSGGKERVEPALAQPMSGIDPDWRERIELARRAYAEGKKMREGKPITFRVSQPLGLGDGP